MLKRCRRKKETNEQNKKLVKQIHGKIQTFLSLLFLIPLMRRRPYSLLCFNCFLLFVYYCICLFVCLFCLFVFVFCFLFFFFAACKTCAPFLKLELFFHFGRAARPALLLKIDIMMMSFVAKLPRVFLRGEEKGGGKKVEAQSSRGLTKWCLFKNKNWIFFMFVWRNWREDAGGGARNHLSPLFFLSIFFQTSKQTNKQTYTIINK